MAEQKKKYTSFQELKKDCINFVEASKNRGAYDGLKQLLTELYPDNAHFIYELLQNAEDTQASAVSFELREDQLIFAHNGKKRDFTLEDIEAITNIGHGTKLDDPTTIGQFGIGFKAVYAYTNTPEIHSGIFNFKIKNMLVPDDSGVPATSKTGITQFVFPFDNPLKAAQTAVEEIKNGLEALDENSILFLRHIKKITYKFPDEKIGYIEMIDDEKNSRNKGVRIKKANRSTTNTTYWIKFENIVDVVDNGEIKHCPIAIAYKYQLISDGVKTKTLFDSSLQGKACIYFPAVKEKSPLRFHINAPFASTVARDSIRACKENTILFNHIAQLVVESLKYFKNTKKIDPSFYAVLPNYRDFENYLSGEYKCIYDELVKAFTTDSYIITDTGEYKLPKDVIQANKQIVGLISSSDAQKLFKKVWVSSLTPQSREFDFINGLGIQTIEAKTIAEHLRCNQGRFDTLYVGKNSQWFANWYTLLGSAPEQHKYLPFFKEVNMILCRDGKLHCAQDGLCLDNSLVGTSSNSRHLCVDINVFDEKQQSALSFLKSLGIKELSKEIDLATKTNQINENGDDALLQVIKLYSQQKNISSYKNTSLFWAYSFENNTKNLCRMPANKCCWNDDVGFFYKNEPRCDVEYVLSIDKYSSLSSSDWLLLREVFEELGGKTLPSIFKRALGRDNPEFSKLEYLDDRDATIKDDYWLSGCKHLDEIGNKELFKQSKMLWDMITSIKQSDQHLATYKGKFDRVSRKYESAAAYYLRRTKWIPNKAGQFCRPCDITEKDLFNGFTLPNDALFLKNIGFGDPDSAPDGIVAEIKRRGLSISSTVEEFLRLSEDEQQEFHEFLQAKKRRKEKERLSFAAALNQGNKEQQDEEEYDDYYVDKGVKNPSSRQSKQEKLFEEGLCQTIKKHKVWKFSYATKNNGPEKQFVKEQYHGKCQICGRDGILKADGHRYFEAINIINTGLLHDEYLNNIDVGWNTLSLCPNCAAEYMYCAKNLSSIENQIESIEIEPRITQSVDLTIELKGKETTITFTPRHFIALKAAFKVFKEKENE